MYITIFLHYVARSARIKPEMLRRVIMENMDNKYSLSEPATEQQVEVFIAFVRDVIDHHAIEFSTANLK